MTGSNTPGFAAKRRLRGSALVFVLAGAVAGCLDPRDSFACSDNAQCVLGGVAGVCHPDGNCSFDDPVCTSGQRYGKHGSAALGGTCVPPSGVASGGSSVGTLTSTNFAGSSSGTSGIGTGSNPNLGSGSTEGPGLTSTQGSTEGEPGLSPDAKTCILFEDDFEDNVIDSAWLYQASDPPLIEEAYGELRLEVTPGSYGTIVTIEDVLDLSSGAATVELGRMPTTDDYEVVIEATQSATPPGWVYYQFRIGQMVLPGQGKGLAVVAEWVEAAQDPVVVGAVRPISDSGPFWLRFRGRSDGLALEDSADGVNFSTRAEGLSVAPHSVEDWDIRIWLRAVRGRELPHARSASFGSVTVACDPAGPAAELP